jgi:hypothetical protein
MNTNEVSRQSSCFFKNSGTFWEIEMLHRKSKKISLETSGGQILCSRGDCGRATAKFGVTLFNWAVSLGRRKSNMGNARSTNATLQMGIAVGPLRVYSFQWMQALQVLQWQRAASKSQKPVPLGGTQPLPQLLGQRWSRIEFHRFA